MGSTARPAAERGLGHETHFWDYLLVVFRRRRLALSVFLTTLALGALRVLLMQPAYSATAEILIEREKANVLAFKEVAEVDSARDDYYQTQYKLLQSRVLVRGVIESLRLLQDPDLGGPRPKAEVEAALARPAGEAALVETAIDAFLKRLSVQPIRNSRIVRVSFEASRPELAARVANRLAQLYIQQSLDLRSETSSDASQWLGAQIADQRAKVAKAEAALRELKEARGLANYEERRTLLEQKLKELGSALNERRTERLQREALYRQMASAPNPEELPEVMRSPIVQSIGIELATLGRQLARTTEMYGDRHPENIKVRSQIAETRKKMAAEAGRIIRSAENDYRAAASQEASLESALEATKHEAEELEKSGIDYEAGKRDLEASQQVLSSLLSRSKETGVAAELKSTNVRVVDPAVVPRRATRPEPLRDMLLTLLLGACLALGAALVAEHLDNRLNTPEDVHKHLGVPLLGVIPEVIGSSHIAGSGAAATSHAMAPFHEGYRVVRTALEYSWPERASRTVLVTSTAPNEGKTISTVNLGTVFAAQADRVLLLDCDLRNPQIHRRTRAARRPGLSDILVGNAKPVEAIQRLSFSSSWSAKLINRGSLFVISAGTPVPNPADLLTSASMRGLLDYLKTAFRWVFVDSPPVGSVSEALMLAPLADGVVIVAGAEMVPRKAIGQTFSRLEGTGARVLGLLLNRAKIERHSYYYGRYYGHYHGRYGVRGEAGARDEYAKAGRKS